ncbi:GcrA family cell cycle regulator [Allorhizobium terrae]|uniref:GcrA cell cycle regulator n=1 Tax=Allorhizobium terrae TaxID=1848972 RepID=A0A4S3ZXN3_9HYPH|nr:GcrA family cell cycle regulator [Allorhizobium terrae]THF50665.1 GcrA cell cycle regulator [Allorhizobium terrae]TWD55582.1 GcrA cell cycle regulator [Agrobacterium vitis]
MNWTDERVEKLKKLWAEGLSASQIATQLGGGVSRNAVIGKVHRLCLPGRVKAGGTTTTPTRTAPKRPAAPAPRAPNYPARTVTRTAPRAEEAVSLKQDMDIQPIEDKVELAVISGTLPTSKRLTLTDLTERTCKWPVGDPMTDDFHFCGCDSMDSSPYCKYHAKLAYQPVNERRRAAAATR